MNECAHEAVSAAPHAGPLPCEAKFLLDSGRVLDEAQQLTETFRSLFGLGAEEQAIDVIFLETPDQAFSNAGWVNRIRWKNGKKKAERTYKKRYPVEGTDEAAVLSALEQARADGFALSGGGYAAELDRGYAKMTLSLTKEATGVYKDYRNLAQFAVEDAAAFFEAAMPQEERDWTGSQWGVSELRRAQMIGPIRLRRFKGRWEDVEITVEICPAGDAVSITELSFKTDDWKAAAETRERLIAFLEEEGILLREDSLKTQAVLSACLLG